MNENKTGTKIQMCSSFTLSNLRITQFFILLGFGLSSVFVQASTDEQQLQEVAAEVGVQSLEKAPIRPRVTYHIALTPREAKKYRISRLRDYNLASHVKSEEQDGVILEEVGYDAVRLYGLTKIFWYLFSGPGGFVNSRVGRLLYEQSPKLLGIPGTSGVVQALGVTTLVLGIPLFVYQTFTTDPNWEALVSSFLLQTAAASKFFSYTFLETAAQFATPFEFAVLMQPIPINQKQQTHSWIGRKFKEWAGLDYPTDAKAFYRAVNRVRLHADRTCQVYGGVEASSSTEIAKLVPVPLLKENFDRGEVWLDGTPITYTEATYHQYHAGQEYYVFKEPFNCRLGLLENDVSISQLLE